MANYDLSVILTFHAEGILAYKTLCAVETMIERLGAIKVEVLANIDRGDTETVNCIESNAKRFNLKISKTDFGNPSEARNFAAKRSKGAFLAFIDGDDLVSKDWLRDGYKMLSETKDDIILHPEANLTFGLDEQPRLWIMKDSLSDNVDDLILLGRNRWCAGTMLKRGIALKFPYEPAVDGFGYEDWHFNSETRAAGIRHLVVPRSVLFYRVKSNSTYLTHMANAVAVAYTNEFNLQRMHQLAGNLPKTRFDSTPPTGDPARMLRLLHYIRRVMAVTPGLKYLESSLAKLVVSYRNKNKLSSIPKFVFDAWREINKIDGELYPDKDVVARMPIYVSEHDYLGYLFCDLMKQIKKEPDYIFLPPVLGVGGTEKVLCNYLQAIHEIHPKWHVVVLGKMPKKHAFSIPDNVDFVDFDGITSKVSDYDKDLLLTRLIIQLKIKHLHVIGSEFYYRWIIRHKEMLKAKNYTINASHFMDEYNDDPDRIVGLVDPLIRECYSCLTYIFTDNEVAKENLVKRCGFDADKIRVHYQPVELKPHQYINPNPQNDKKVHILWAGRVSQQKRPDLLIKIAKSLDKKKYVVDVFGRIQEPCKKSLLQKAKNIAYHGAFYDISKLSGLSIHKYSCFLYTSQTDGIPNILLEISALGLPIVASNAGGVKDFIQHEKTGELIENIEDIASYKASLEKVSADNKLAERYVKNAQHLLLKRHSWKNFVKMVAGDIR